MIQTIKTYRTLTGTELAWKPMSCTTVRAIWRINRIEHSTVFSECRKNCEPSYAVRLLALHTKFELDMEFVVLEQFKNLPASYRGGNPSREGKEPLRHKATVPFVKRFSLCRWPIDMAAMSTQLPLCSQIIVSQYPG